MEYIGAKKSEVVFEPTFEAFGIEMKNPPSEIASMMMTPLSQWGITKSGLDTFVNDGSLKGSVLLEIKEYKNITQPKQRFEDDKSKEVDVSLLRILP